MGEVEANVLLIADDPEQSEPLRRSLEAGGVAPGVCPDLTAVQDALKGNARNLVIYGASDISGAALQQTSRLKDAAANVPLLIHMTTFREVTRLRFLEAGADDLVPDEVLAQTAAVMLEPGPGQGGASQSPGAPGDMYFQLKEGELSNALQFLCMTGRTGLLRLRFPDGETGQVFLADNTVAYVSLGGATGTEALARMIGRAESEAHFFEGRKAPRIVNTRPISQVLIEAAVMADEIKAANGGG